jgi:hypothetical protein
LPGRDGANPRGVNIAISPKGTCEVESGELKDKLRKRAQAQDGTKPVLLKSLRYALVVRIPVWKNIAQQKAN